MSIFALTFRIHEDTTYRDRYQSVVEAIKQCCHGVYWDEPTSFFLFENPAEAQAIADWINANSRFAPDRDLLLVINQSVKSYGVIGHVKNLATLKALMAKR